MQKEIETGSSERGRDLKTRRKTGTWIGIDTSKGRAGEWRTESDTKGEIEG